MHTEQNDKQQLPDATACQQAAAEQAYRERAAALEAARTGQTEVTNRLHSLTQLIQAAQTEAATAKATWAQLLRESDGTLTPDIHQHRATERAAYTLIEEYDAFRLELQQQHDWHNVEVAERALHCKDAYRQLLQAKADWGLKRIMAAFGTELAVVRELHDRAERSVDDRSSPIRLTPDILRERFFLKLERRLDENATEASARVAAELDGMTLNLHGVDRELMHSPLQRQRKRVELGDP